MTCPRGEHGNLVQERNPDSLRCWICGHQEYPQYKGRMPESRASIEPRPHLSAKQKKQREAVIASLAERGYTNHEIQEATGYSRYPVEKAARAAREGIQ